MTNWRTADDELGGVTGGLVVISIIGICIGLLLPVVNRPVNPPPRLLIIGESKLLVASS